jgi:hypothetical protein
MVLAGEDGIGVAGVTGLYRLAAHVKGNLVYWVREGQRRRVNQTSCKPWEENA